MRMIICNVEICHRPKDTKSSFDFCTRHEVAYENIQTTFEEWKVAYGNKYKKKKYYQNLLKNNDVPSGKWVREVVKHLLEEELTE